MDARSRNVLILVLMAAAILFVVYYFWFGVSVNQTLQANGIDPAEFKTKLSSFNRPLEDGKLWDALNALQQRPDAQSQTMAKVLKIKQRENSALKEFEQFFQSGFGDQCGQIETFFFSFNKETSEIVADAEALNPEIASNKLDFFFDASELKKKFEAMYDSLDAVWNQCLLISTSEEF